MPSFESDSLHELKAEVETKLGLARSTHREEAALGDSPPQLFDPADVEREQVGLRSVLGARSPERRRGRSRGRRRTGHYKSDR